MTSYDYDFANKLKHVTEERKRVFENIHIYGNIGLLGITKVVFYLLRVIMFIFASNPVLMGTWLVWYRHQNSRTEGSDELYNICLYRVSLSRFNLYFLILGW